MMPYTFQGREYLTREEMAKLYRESPAEFRAYSDRLAAEGDQLHQMMIENEGERPQRVISNEEYLAGKQVAILEIPLADLHKLGLKLQGDNCIPAEAILQAARIEDGILRLRIWSENLPVTREGHVIPSINLRA